MTKFDKFTQNNTKFVSNFARTSSNFTIFHPKFKFD